MEGSRHKRWSKEEEDYVKNNWGRIKTKDIARKLNRNTSSVYRKATRLNLKMSDEEYENVTDKLKWTDEMKKYVMDNYGVKPTEDIMRHLDINDVHKLRNQAKYLGVSKDGHVWSSEEENYLMSNWGDVSIRYMAKRLNVSTNAILQKANKLKLGNQLYYSGDWYTATTISELLGVNKRAVYNWMQKGLLEHKLINVGSVYRARVRYNSLSKFLERYTELYDTRDCDLELLKAVVSKKLNSRNSIEPGDNVPKWLYTKIEQDKIGYDKTEIKFWTKLEELRLIHLVREGKTNNELSRIFGRTKYSIEGKLRKLGIKR